MNSRDRKLGMNRAITRRDFMSGVGLAVGSAVLPSCATNSDPGRNMAAGYYPPGQTGMRGAHPGSFEAAHALVQGQRFDTDRIDEHYDLVVVGAGLSGLSAAYMYRRDVDPNARILVLDNHDDFGGHAKRNEFVLDGRTYIGFGGTMLIESPKTYPPVAWQLMQELGIDLARFRGTQNKELIKKFGLGDGTFFDRETFGADFMTTGRHGFSDSISEAPLSASGRAELTRLYADEEDYLAGMGPDERRAVVESLSYSEYLEKYARIGEEVLTYVQKLPHGVWAIGSDACPAWLARADGYPGFANMDIGDADTGEAEADDEYYRFPDGNASVARLLVRKLVPGAAPGNSMEDVVSARFDYTHLDRPENRTRIRLNSTVVGISHQGGELDADVDISYVTDDRGHTLTAGKVIWAGYHAMLPYVCSDIPWQQADAQGSSVRAPLVYTSVLIRDWNSLANLGLRRVYCPGSFFQRVMLSHEVSFGDHHFAESPDVPIVLHLQHIPLQPGLPAAEQFRAGRRRLLATPFETFERNARDQLGRMLGTGGFDPARDIAAITVNRWPHGYAYSVDSSSGEVAWWPERWRHEQRPWVAARKRVGNITIAGTDAASNAMTEAAIEEAHRAVQELKKS